MASNSLIEAVVYADAAAQHSLNTIDEYTYNTRIPEWNDEGTRSPEEMVLITQSMKEVNVITSYSIHYTKLYDYLVRNTSKEILKNNLNKENILLFMSFNFISAAEAASLVKHGYNIGLSGSYNFV